MTERIPPEIQQYALKAQKIQNQLAQVVTEKSTVEAELREINIVLSTLEKLSDDVELYKSIGHLLIRTRKEDVVKELNERKEILELRLKAIQKQESILRQQLSEVQRKLNELLTRSYQQVAK